jgi:hypothetical protein
MEFRRFPTEDCDKVLVRKQPAKYHCPETVAAEKRTVRTWHTNHRSLNFDETTFDAYWHWTQLETRGKPDELFIRQFTGYQATAQKEEETTFH